MKRGSTIALMLLAGAGAVHAANEFPGCEAWKGPGYFAHPDFPYTCCWPGTVPVPGKPVCVVPGSPAAQKYLEDPNANIRDAEGRPGAPGGHCIPLNQTCTLGGAPCCEGNCEGTFPNTVCR